MVLLRHGKLNIFALKFVFRSGIEEEVTEMDYLLQQIHELMQEFVHSKKADRKTSNATSISPQAGRTEADLPQGEMTTSLNGSFHQKKVLTAPSIIVNKKCKSLLSIYRKPF